MKISEVQIIPVKPANGLVGFASCVIDKSLYIGSLGIHQLIDGSGYRITYPTKLLGSRQLNYYYPISKEAGRLIEEAITNKCQEIFEKSDENNGRHSKTTHQNK